MATILRWVGNVLQMNQTVKSNPFAASASSFLGLRQSVKTSPYILKVSQRFIMRTPLKLGRTSQLSASSLFHMENRAYKVLDASASNRINLYHFARTCAYENVLQFFNLSQTVEGEIGKGTNDTIAFTQSVGVTVVRNEVVTQVLIMQSNMVGYIPNDEFYAIPISLPGGPPGDDGRS